MGELVRRTPLSPEMEVVGLALEMSSRRAFRAEVLRRMLGWLDADAACCHQLYPTIAAPDEHVGVGINPTTFARMIEHWDEYGPQFQPIAEAAGVAGGVAIDTHVYTRGERSRLSVYADIAAPERYRETVCCSLPFRDATGAILCLMRIAKNRAPFTARTLAVARGLLPVVTLGDALLAHREHAAEREIAIASLTAREKRVAEVAAMGFSAPDVAVITGVPTSSVRSDMATALDKARGERARSPEWMALTPRRARVFELVVRGLSNKEIAKELGCADNTVEWHVTQILRQAGLQGRLQLVASYWSGALRRPR
jgi:DNA-binding NarL/FixJ family response regulator